MIKLFLIVYFLLVLISPAYGVPKCPNENWKHIEYENKSIGDVSIYTIQEIKDLTSTNLACVFYIEFLKRVNNFPEKTVVGLSTVDNKKAVMIQWDIKNDTFTLFALEDKVLKVDKYKNPLSRSKDIFLNKMFKSEDYIKGYSVITTEESFNALIGKPKKKSKPYNPNNRIKFKNNIVY